MKKLFTLVMLLAVMCVFGEPSFAKAPDKDIIILYTNDVHCGVDENIGYAGFAFCADEVRKESPYVTLVDAGDWAQGGTIGAISQGRYILEIMNAVGYDIAVPGNHEFDYNWSQFENFAKNLKCGFICCNLRDLRTGELVFKPYRILTYGDVKVAFVGVATPESITTSTPYYFMDENGKYIYDFDGEHTGQKLIASIQKAVDSARAEGADYVIVVGHLGEYDDVVDVWAVPFIAPRTKGIDVFIDGHSHEITPSLVFKNAESKDVIVTQTGTKLNNVGKLTISKEGRITTELINKVDGKDAKITALINEKKAILESTLSKRLSHTSFDLLAKDEKGNWLVRNSETNLCNLITDAFLDSAKKTKTGKADIAVNNAGGFRTDIKAGEITYSDVLGVLPFNNTVCICEVPGQSLLDELELGAQSLPDNNGGFLHVSGMTYTVDSSIPTPVIVDDKNMLVAVSGDRRVRDVKVNGEPLDPAKMYKVVSTSYVLYMNGDGHMFRGAKVIEPDYIAYDQTLANYVKQFETLPEKYRNAEGRIKFVK
ncbi:MAG: bifunctional metallophosphatase/5'-nucleotidase [Synergistaceae bacterium]|nr:bifunctional metallophosphatase/5'-nucleotidase [Synergistaceae bacterium]